MVWKAIVVGLAIKDYALRECNAPVYKVVGMYVPEVLTCLLQILVSSAKKAVVVPRAYSV